MSVRIETLPCGPMGARGEVLSLGRRRAYRVVRWLGGVRLPRVGREVELRGGIVVRCWRESRYDVRGPREELARLATCLTAQERVERAAARRKVGGA